MRDGRDLANGEQLDSGSVTKSSLGCENVSCQSSAHESSIQASNAESRVAPPLLRPHEHPSLMSSDHGTHGNGLVLLFHVDDFDQALQRARSLVTRLEEEPHVNPNTETKEFSLRNPNGYYVTISALPAA
jgi:hypothetical protein